MTIATGASIERSSWLPSEWGVTVTTLTTDRLFEVVNTIPSTEQVFLVRCPHNTGNWQCYEFQEASFIAVVSGSQTLSPFAGVIYDPSCKAAQFKSAVDSTPSNYVDTEVEVFNLEGNAVSDIDPRYRFNNSEPPPYNQCTEKSGVGSEGKTNLSSKPAGITLLSDLSDVFAPGPVDADRWQEYSQAVRSWASGRDWGAGDSGQVQAHRVQQIGGAIRFGQDGETTAQYNGKGVKSKWSIDGAFQIDFTLQDPENINDGGGAAFGSNTMGIVGFVRLSPNEGVGFLVWRSSTGPQVYVRGIYMQLDGTFGYSADVAAADGDVIRIVRDGSNVWTLTHDPSGTPTDITPGGGSNYAEAVYMVLAALPGALTFNWVEPGTLDGSEPGFSGVTVSGAGSLGLYYGGVKHDFAWDHVADLGADKSGQVEMFVDTQST